MKVYEARQALNQQLDALSFRRNQIHSLLKETDKAGGNNFDRLELSKELEALDKSYENTFQERERVNEIGAAAHNAEASKQQAEAEAEANEEMMKCLEIFRRIAKGDKVPATDERKLMEFDGKMYMMAKNMSVVHMGKEGEKWDSLWDEESEKKEEDPDPSEVGENTEVDIVMPEVPPETEI